MKKGDIVARFYVELESRAHDPRNDTDDDEESKEEKEAVPLKKYQISLRFARQGIQDTDPDMIQTFTDYSEKPSLWRSTLAPCTLECISKKATWMYY